MRIRISISITSRAQTQRIVTIERKVVDEHAQHRGRCARAAVSHDADGVEHLEGARRDGDQQHEQLRRQHGQCNLEEGLRRRGRVQLRRFIDFKRNGLQGAEDDQHVIANVFPCIHHNDTCHGCI